jgi:hypothetical protein
MSKDGYTRTINFLTPIGFEKASREMENLEFTSGLPAID